MRRRRTQSADVVESVSISTAAAAALPEEVRRAVVESYYPRQVAASDSARSRAQGAYAIASGIALALVAAGILTNLDAASGTVRWLAVVTVAAWLIAAFMFFRAIASPPPKQGAQAEIADPTEFVRHVLNTARRERDDVDARVRLAYWPTFTAVALTVVTIAAVATDKSPAQLARIALSPSGEAAVRQMCPALGRKLTGRVVTETLGESWVTVRINKGQCSGRSELRLPLTSIQAVAMEP